MFRKLRPYLFLFIILIAVVLGSATGIIFREKANSLKPLGDIFLNLMFTVVVPLVFFSVASAIANMRNSQNIATIMGKMFGVFLFTGLIAALFMLAVVKLFPLNQDTFIQIPHNAIPHSLKFSDQISNILTVPSFYQLFTRENLLALIVFSILVGIATNALGDKAQIIKNLLNAGTELCMKLVSYVIYYAPIGFFAYFAVLTGEFGPTLLDHYARSIGIYYGAALVYMLLAFSFYAWLSDHKRGIKTFWKNTPLPLMTALATSSSAASIPANLQATRQMGVPPEIYETTIPLGAILHKDGSVLGGMLKIAFLFGIYHLSFSGFSILVLAVLASVLVGTIMGAIPSGGMIAEVLILSIFGFPPQALMLIASISILIDPLATALNVLGDSVASMLLTRLIKIRP